MGKIIYREGPTIYISIIFTDFVLLCVLAILSLLIWMNCAEVNSRHLEDVASLTRAEASGLAAIDELSQSPGTVEARAAITEYDLEQEKKLMKELEAQKKRVAKAKAEQAEKDAKDRILKEAQANTAATWSGSGWDGQPLTRGRGTITGPSGKETYYNLNMSTCVAIMRGMGFSEEEYPYNVREDGCKCLGDYVMVAANLRIRPKGSFIMTSCGVGIVVDTGGFAAHNPTQLDLAVTW